MLEKGIINDSEKRQTTDQRCGLTEDQRIDKLLDTLRCTVKEDGSIFDWFIQILKKKDTILTNKTADKLIDDYKIITGITRLTIEEKPKDLSPITPGSKDIAIIEGIERSGIFEQLTQFTVDSRGYTHNCKEYGVSLYIPEGAIHETATVWFGACLYSDKFKFPDGHTPVTPVVWVYIDQELMKRAQLSLPHHVDITEMSEETVRQSLTVLSADDESFLNNAGSLMFRKCDQKLMHIKEKTLNFTVEHFCSFCVVRDKLKTFKTHFCNEPSKRYYAFQGIKRQGNTVHVEIGFLYDETYCKEKISDQFKDQGYTIEKERSGVFKFPNNSKKIQIIFQPALSEIHGWDYRYDKVFSDYIDKEEINYWKIVRAKGEKELKKLEEQFSYPPRYSLVFERKGSNDRTRLIVMKLDGANCNIPIHLVEVPESTSMQLEETTPGITPGPTTCTTIFDQFAAATKRLHYAISSCLNGVVSGLHAKDILGHEFTYDIINVSETNLKKAQKLVAELEKKLNNDRNPEKFMEIVCSVLIEQKERQLTQIANELKPIPHHTSKSHQNNCSNEYSNYTTNVGTTKQNEQQSESPNQELTIKDLETVLTALKDAQFSFSDWDKLGLGLGLYKTSLDTIQSNYPRDNDRCLTECLSKWLQRADKVDAKGGPTWSSLVDALEDINKAATEEIRGKYVTL